MKNVKNRHDKIIGEKIEKSYRKSFNSIGIDTKEDLEKLELILKR